MANYDEFAQWYDLAYESDSQADILGYIKLITQIKNPAVLEMGSGSGRILKALAEAGINCTGIELSKKMIEKAEERLKDLPSEIKNKITIHQGDSSKVSLEKMFCFVLFPYSILFEIETRQDVEASIANGFRHLLPEGHLIIDNAYYGPGGGQLEDNVIKVLKTVSDPSDPNGLVSFFEASKFNPKTNERIKYLFVDKFGPQKPVMREYFEINKRFYISPETMKDILQTIGFVSIELFGNFNFVPFDECSNNKRQIWICRKGENGHK